MHTTTVVTLTLEDVETAIAAFEKVEDHIGVSKMCPIYQACKRAGFEIGSGMGLTTFSKLATIDPDNDHHYELSQEAVNVTRLPAREWPTLKAQVPLTFTVTEWKPRVGQ